MNIKTAAALEDSIRHWEENLAAKMPLMAPVGPKDCALCNLFFFYSDCNGCPVMEKTGRKYCEGTPYRKAASTRMRWRNSCEDATRDEWREKWRRACRDEIAFLKSLRQTETEK